MSVDGSEDKARPMTKRATPDQMHARIEALKAHEARNRGTVSVSPHGFEPLRFWDLRPAGRCKACLRPRIAHPTCGYVPARALGNKSPADTESARAVCSCGWEVDWDNGWRCFTRLRVWRHLRGHR